MQSHRMPSRKKIIYVHIKFHLDVFLKISLLKFSKSVKESV